MALVKELTDVPALGPAAALVLWTDVSRWPTFVEGFAHAERLDPSWPAEGARVVWRSIPSGRGRVTERVTAFEAPSEGGEGRIVTEVFEDALSGVQTASFRPADEPDESWLELSLEYTLTSSGALRQITDVLFIRRALSAALRRTLERFAVEAAEQGAL